MSQLGKNLVLALCVVTALLVILGLKQRFGGGEASLLSQPSEEIEMTAPNTTKNSPRPRVLQARPVTQHDDREILSPTGSPYADSEIEASRGNGDANAPIPTESPNPVAAPRPLNVPELVPVGVAVTSPVTADNANGEVPQATPAIETPTTPATTRALPESVLTGSEDSFWSISEQVYGSGKYYRALFRHNEAKVLRPDQLRPGIEVRTPPLEVLRQLYPADFPGEPSLAPSP